MIDFPNSPTPGQVFNSGTGPIYIWDGLAWNLVTQATRTARQNNLIVNGALTVSQENGNTEGTTTLYYPADQFFSQGGGTGYAFGFSRIAATNLSGSQFRMQYRVTTAKASLLTGDSAFIMTKMEGLNTMDLGWNNAASQKDAVLQFGFNGPAGTYAVAIRNASLSQSFIAPITITAGQANTDTLQTIKVPAPTGLTNWPTDNTPSLMLSFTLASGATYLAPTAGWSSANYLGLTGMSNGLAAVQSFQIWDVGLYADPDKTGLAPPFETEDYATTLAKCQRYWTALTTVYLAGYSSAGNSIQETYTYPTQMRTNPSIGYTNLANISNLSNLVLAYASQTNVTPTITVVASGAGIITFNINSSARL